MAAPVATDTPTTDPGPDAPNDSAVYDRRRRLAGWATVVAVGFILGLWAPAALHSNSPENTTPHAVTDTGDSDGRTAAGGVPLDRHLDDAVTFNRETGSFDGFTVDDTNINVVAVGQTVVISTIEDGVCMFTGHVDGQTSETLADPTGEACDPAALALLHEQLTVHQQQTVEYDNSDAQHSVEAAIESVVYALSLGASLEEATALIDNVETYHTGDTVTFTAVAGQTGCYTATLTADGTVTGAGPC